MTRLKFVVFAVIALGLWVAHLFLVSPPVASAAIDQATSAAAGAPAAVALRLESSRSELQAAVLKLASTPAVLMPTKGGKVEAPTAERFTQVRGAATEAFAEPLRDKIIVGIANEAGALMAQGGGDPVAPAEGFDAKLAAASGGKGEVMEAYGLTHLVYSVPLYGVEKGEAKQIGAAFVGLPLVINAQALIDGVVKDLSLSGLSLSVGGKVVASGGSKKSLLDGVARAAKPGKSAAAEKGSARTLGPLKLPLATAGDTMGGESTLEVGVRRDIPGTPFEVIAISSVRPAMEALADYQKTAVFMLAGLLAAALAFIALIGGKSDEEHEPYVAPSRVPSNPVQLAVPPKSEPAPLPIADAPPAPEAHPDDFQFASSPTQAPEPEQEQQEPPPEQPEPTQTGTEQAEAYAPPPVNEPAEDDFAALRSAPPAPARAAPPTMGLGEGDDDQRTSAYPKYGQLNPMAMATTAPGAVIDPFALAGGQLGSEEQQQNDDNPEATKVAVIPQELLKASSRNTGENPGLAMPRIAAPMMPRVASVASAPPPSGSEEAHFQSVFQDFVATREKCGEPADGLTYEKFVAKLRKNKDQLVAKYNCKTVRFQVYVKEGKAALKATPVKE